jgi:hypothetical protein
VGSIIRPALSDRKGWCLFIGTPHGLNLFHDLYQSARDGFLINGQRVKDPEWSALMFRVDETNLIDAKELASARATMSEAQFRQEFLCDFSASQDNVLITIDLVSEACQRVVTESDVAGLPKILGVDVARYGDDRSVIIRRQGLVAFAPIVQQGVDNMTLAAKVAAEINIHSIDAVFIDAGRGEGVIDRLRQLNFPSVFEVNFGGKPTNDAYANKRSWDETDKWLKAGGAIPDHPDLKADLCSPTYSFNAAGKIVLESKDQIKARGLRSTDVGDALALTFSMPVAPAATSLARGKHTSEWDPFSSMYRRPVQSPYYTSGSTGGDRGEYDPMAQLFRRGN